MRIGVGRIVLDYHGNLKAAEKRQKLEELGASLRKRFNLSIAEIADFDDPERCVIGFAAVIPDHWSNVEAERFTEKICRTIDETAVPRVMVEDWDLIEHG